MDFQFSEVIEPGTYEHEGLCDGIPLRMHNQTMKENIGTTRCQSDWDRLVGPIKNYRGGLDARFNFMSVSVPECIPERLEIISYANEFAFLYDDETEGLGEQELNRRNDDLEATFVEAAQNGGITDRSSGKKQMQAMILNEMMSIDRDRALTTMTAWAEFLRLAAGRQHSRIFTTLEEYLPYRSIDVGKWFWYGMVTFGMALTLTADDLATCETIMVPAWRAAALQNDIFSWPKEKATALQLGNRPNSVINAIPVLMQEHNISEESALRLCRQKTREYVSQYVCVVESYRHDETLSRDLRVYLEAMLYSLSGNAVWSAYCPRYHPENTYSNLQLELIEKVNQQGVPHNEMEAASSLA